MTKQQFAFSCLLFATASIFPTVIFSALTQDPAVNWHTLYTDHFDIHFHDGEETLAHEVADISERVHSKLTKTFRWSPGSRTQIVLTDRFDFANGLAYPMPRNWMQLIVTAPDSFSSLGDYHNWLEMLITHEYSHILHFDKSSGLPRSLRNIFGRFIFLFPNLLQPPWLIEGLATYDETDHELGTGRGQNSYFRMLMRMEVENGIKPLSQVNQPLVSWPMNTSRYLYGVYFYNFIASRYGEDKIQQLIDNYSNNILPLAINSNSRETLGKSMNELWAEFKGYLNNEFAPEIKIIKQRGVTNPKQLTHSGYYNTSPKILPNGDVYFIQSDMQSEPRLVVIKQGKGKLQPVTNTRGRYFDIHPKAGVVVAELDAYNNTNFFSDLYQINPVTGRKTRLTRGGRYLYASWSPDGQKIVAVHNELGEHALHLLDNRGNLKKILWQGKNKSVLGPPDWSPNSNELVVSVWRPATQWNLEIFDLDSHQWRQLTHTNNIETTPQFINNGKEILFSADYGGVFNLHQLHLDSGKITTLSNVVSGAFSPAVADDTNTSNKPGMYYTAPGKNGFDLFYLETPRPLSTPDADTSRETVNTITGRKPAKIKDSAYTEPSKDKAINDYNALSYITPTAWYPYFLGTDERNEIGINTWGSDPIKRHSYALTAAYDTDNKWYVGHLNYLYDRWNPSLKLSFSRNAIAYIDNNNDIERFRNQDTVSIELLWPTLTHEQQLLLHTGIIHQVETDKDIRSTFGPLGTTNDDLAGVALSYNSTHRYPISIGPNYGRQIRVVAEDYDLLESFHTGQVFTIDWKEFFSLSGQQVVSTRGVFGWGSDSPERFRLGGINETSISADPNHAAYAATERIFGQRKYPLHGYPLGRSDLTGTRLLLLELEWAFPIARVERGWMIPPVGLHQVHGKFFYNWGEAWDADLSVPPLRSGAGVELTAETTLGYWLPSDVSIGYAKGFNKGGEEQAYIKLQALF